jgi:hypothetical protein
MGAGLGSVWRRFHVKTWVMRYRLKQIEAADKAFHRGAVRCSKRRRCVLEDKHLGRCLDVALLPKIVSRNDR